MLEKQHLCWEDANEHKSQAGFGTVGWRKESGRMICSTPKAVLLNWQLHVILAFDDSLVFLLFLLWQKVDNQPEAKLQY